MGGLAGLAGDCASAGGTETGGKAATAEVETRAEEGLGGSSAGGADLTGGESGGGCAVALGVCWSASTSCANRKRAGCVRDNDTVYGLLTMTQWLQGSIWIVAQIRNVH